MIYACLFVMLHIEAALINLILKITYSLDNFPCQLTFMSKPISIYILCLHQLPLLTRRAIPSIYFKACSVSLLAALRNRTKKQRHIFPRNKITTVPRLKDYVKYTFLSQLSVIDTRNKLVIFFEETYVFIFCYEKPRGQPSLNHPQA